MVRSSTAFADAFQVLFSPLGDEYGLESRYPSAAETIRNIGLYQNSMAELQEALLPEVELVESRIMAPVKEMSDMMKKIRKAITKRDHKVGLASTARISSDCVRRRPTAGGLRSTQ